MLFCRLLIFFKINFLKNSFRNTIRMSNGLDPDQAGQFVGPDLGPNCLPRLSDSVDDTGRQRVKTILTSAYKLNFIAETIKSSFSREKDR